MAEANMPEKSGPPIAAHAVPKLVPTDEHNRTLLHNVHPPDWRNPQPAPRYNLVVIGAGTAGLVTAAGAAGLGARVALIERYLLGGDCLNVGCVPSKCVIRSSRVVGDVHDAARLGVPLRDGAEPDFGAVMERMRRLRARISHHDSAERFQHELGVDIFLGDARFTGPDTVAVGGTALRFKRAVIATGARASHPPIRGPRRVIELPAGEVAVDEILVGAGRAPNVGGLGLEAVGVQYDPARGVLVNDRLQTTNPRIYAAGDVCMQHKFTHMADAAARIVIQNTLFLGRKKLSALHVPWCTYTDPEIAHVGMYERDAARQGIAVDTFVTPLSTVDRAIADGEEEGFVKVHVKKGTDRILGATIVARHAGEMLNELTLAMVGGLGLGTLANVIHPYPTQAEAIRKTADAYNRTRLTPTVKKAFQRWLAWTR